MPTTATWQAATPGQPTWSGHVGQFLGCHSAQLVYPGAQQAGQATGSAVYTSTAGVWLGQAFTPTGSQTGQVWVQVSAVGGSPVTALLQPLTVSLYADTGGLPSGSPLATTTVGCEYVYTAPFWVPLLLPTTVTPGVTYHIVTTAVGTTTGYYAWQQSNQQSGAATSPDGTTWTPAAYGLMYQVYDQSAAGPAVGIIEDGGARWTQLTYTPAGQLATISEFTAGQAGGYLYSTRALTYNGALLIGVA